MGEMEDILDSIERPLLFASKNSFSHLSNIKGLESTIRQITAIGGQLSAVSSDKREKLQKIAENLKGFDAMPISEKKDSVLRAIEIVGELRENPSTSQPLNLSTSSPYFFIFLSSLGRGIFKTSHALLLFQFVNWSALSIASFSTSSKGLMA